MPEPAKSLASTTRYLLGGTGAPGCYGGNGLWGLKPTVMAVVMQGGGTAEVVAVNNEFSEGTKEKIETQLNMNTVFRQSRTPNTLRCVALCCHALQLGVAIRPSSTSTKSNAIHHSAPETIPRRTWE